MKPIDLFFDAELNDYDLSKFTTDRELLEHVRKGLTEAAVYRNDDGIIQLDEVYRSITPDNFYQNLNTGQNNIDESQSAIVYLYLDPYMDGKTEKPALD